MPRPVGILRLARSAVLRAPLVAAWALSVASAASIAALLLEENKASEPRLQGESPSVPWSRTGSASRTGSGGGGPSDSRTARIYSLSVPELKVLNDYLQENLSKGFIRPSTSPAGAALFFVGKKDGSLRPCIDYRELNKTTVKNRYPLPLIPELLEIIRSAKIFTKLDLRGAYNLVRIRPGDEWKTAFRTRYGHYEYLVMPFGLCNVPATFQHLINDVLRELLDQFVVAYLDDILVFSDNIMDHQRHVRIVLERLRKYKLYIKLEKCEFEKTSMQFLGYIISPEGLSMDPGKIQAVVEWPIPRNEKDIQRFVGFANFYRRFIKNFSGIIAPITQLTQKEFPFKWSPEADAAFEQLKSLFTSAPILIHPNPELPFILEVDASDSAVAERIYDIGNKELLAIKAAFSEWRHLLEGGNHPITVFTDHRNLEFIRSAKRLSARQARWALFFARFQFHISYRSRLCFFFFVGVDSPVLFWSTPPLVRAGFSVSVAPGGHVSPEMEQVSSPGSASSTLLEEHHGDEDDEYDEDDATEETEIQSCDHEEVPIETVVPPNRPSTSTYDAIVASEGKIVDAENRRHSDMMTVLERMIGLQEETVSQLAHLHRVFIEVPKQLQKINTSFEALVVQQTQANYWRMTNVPQFNTSQPGSVHAGQFSPHSSDIHSPGPNVTGQVADIAVQVPDDILPLPSVQIQQQTPTKEATKTKQDTHETDQPSLVQCLPTCSHVSLGTSPVREQSLPKSPVGESLPKRPVGESLPKSPVGESLPKSPVGESLPKSPVGESLPKSPVGESLPKSPVGESLPKSPVGESLPKSPVGESLATSPVGESLATSPVGEQSLATSPAREVPEATQSGSVVPKVGGKRKRKIQETTSRPVTRSQKEQKK
ncbi:uncharacterized protein LOC142504012 [Ascaphus truei]|uniref:uncharacterized protein LOC142504012 n=1 Tax=Ascaphus truei TaxID=8439 RepID=UPI003F59D1B4